MSAAELKQLASNLDRNIRVLLSHQESDQSEDVIYSMLREVWNGRGAADIEKIGHWNIPQDVFDEIEELDL